MSDDHDIFDDDDDDIFGNGAGDVFDDLPDEPDGPDEGDEPVQVLKPDNVSCQLVDAFPPLDFISVVPDCSSRICQPIDYFTVGQVIDLAMSHVIVLVAMSNGSQLAAVRSVVACPVGLADADYEDEYVERFLQEIVPNYIAHPTAVRCPFMVVSIQVEGMGFVDVLVPIFDPDVQTCSLLIKHRDPDEKEPQTDPDFYKTFCSDP